MRGLVVYNDAPLADLRLATRRALANLVDTAIEEAVDLVVLAGDVFDGDWQHISSGVHFVTEMRRLRDAGIRVVAIAGNHDAESKITKGLHLPDNVSVLSTRQAETKIFEDIGVAVHGQGYAKPAIHDDLSLGYAPPVGGLVNVGLLHTSADGRPGHENYAPCTVQGLVNRGYDYFALGHVHKREVLCEAPAIVFAGILQGRGLRETGPKGATLVEVAADGTLSHEHRVLDCVRWEVVEVGAAGAANRDEVCERVGAALRDAADAAGDRLLAARVVISGATDAHAQLVADHERMRYEVIAAAADAAGSQVWVEGTRIRTNTTRPPAASGDDAVGELINELEHLANDDIALAELTTSLRSLANTLPVAVLEDFNPLDLGIVRELLAEVERSLPIALLERANG
jgi:DNA repair exonuclease SbcCD nuclease subunit